MKLFCLPLAQRSRLRLWPLVVGGISMADKEPLMTDPAGLKLPLRVVQIRGSTVIYDNDSYSRIVICR